MKLRIQDNSIRLRLTRTEVERMQQEGRVSSTVAFADGAGFEYVLETSADDETRARFTGARMVVSVPRPVIGEWASSDEVSIGAQQPLGRNGELSILVEKDFACLTPREGEDESDMFPHPLRGEESC